MVREKGSFTRGKNINLQILINQDLNNSIGVGYIATKKIGKAFKRNRARRIMKELAKKILIKSKINSYFVLIAKPSLLETPFEELFKELLQSNLEEGGKALSKTATRRLNAWTATVTAEYGGAFEETEIKSEELPTPETL